jgi:hypothetical protein
VPPLLAACDVPCPPTEDTPPELDVPLVVPAPPPEAVVPPDALASPDPLLAEVDVAVAIVPLEELPLDEVVSPYS